MMNATRNVGSSSGDGDSFHVHEHVNVPASSAMICRNKVTMKKKIVSLATTVIVLGTIMIMMKHQQSQIVRII